MTRVHYKIPSASESCTSLPLPSIMSRFAALVSVSLKMMQVSQRCLKDIHPYIKVFNNKWMISDSSHYLGALGSSGDRQESARRRQRRGGFWEAREVSERSGKQRTRKQCQEQQCQVQCGLWICVCEYPTTKNILYSMKHTQWHHIYSGNWTGLLQRGEGWHRRLQKQLLQLLDRLIWQITRLLLQLFEFNGILLLMFELFIY